MADALWKCILNHVQKSQHLVLLIDINRNKSYPYMVHPLLPLPMLYRNLGVIPG